MNRISTLRFNDSELITNEWHEDYPLTTRPATLDSTSRQAPSDTHSVARIFLQWAHHQEVVDLPQESFYTRTGKRIVDVVIAGLVTVFILSWMIPLVGALIWLESAGPVFFIQGRSGRKGKEFACLKFRTMHQTPKGAGFQQTQRNDARVTWMGRFLRRTNLDEMPQFINVLLGDMSLVGPRPHAVPHDAMHWASAAYRERYWVRPGITGLAQIRGARGATSHQQSMDHRVRYDHFYIPRQTFLLDMKICVWTLDLMLRGDRNAW